MHNINSIKITQRFVTQHNIKKDKHELFWSVFQVFLQTCQLLAILHTNTE